jgi:hypothetical protein
MEDCLGFIPRRSELSLLFFVGRVFFSFLVLSLVIEQVADAEIGRFPGLKASTPLTKVSLHFLPFLLRYLGMLMRG